MYVYEMRQTRDKSLTEHSIEHDGRFIGYLIAYSPAQIAHVHNRYDVWVVDDGQTLLLQFGREDGLCRTMSVHLVPRLAALANNQSNELWAYAYHMYLKDTSGE